MQTFLIIFFSSVYLISGYSAGSQIDTQYRHLGQQIRKISIPTKYRFLYKFHWHAGSEVLIHAFIIESAALICVLLTVLWGILCLVFPFLYINGMITFCILAVYGIILIACSAHCIYLSAWFTKSQSYGRRCLDCELQAHFSRKTPYRKVFIFGKGKSFYYVRYGKIVRRNYCAIASKNYKPNIGESSDAVYTRTPPYFILIPPSHKMM